MTITVDGCVSQGATTSVIVNAVPLATATNDSPTCMGADVQLNSNTSTTGATVTYQWSVPIALAPPNKIQLFPMQMLPVQVIIA
ncbi:MAG: hypothetical protein R3E32_14165 [Chitinophagales bacterium]